MSVETHSVDFSIDSESGREDHSRSPIEAGRKATLLTIDYYAKLGPLTVLVQGEYPENTQKKRENDFMHRK